MRARPATLAWAAAALVLARATPCWPETDDGAYGRLRGDFVWQADAGGAIRDSEPGATLSLSARYLDTAGLYALGFASFRRDEHVARTLSSGIELRPLFLPRFLKNMERGPAALDLLVDSVALRFGAVASDERGHRLRELGVEAGVQLGLPLTGHVTGPWLRVGWALQWPHAALASRDAPNSSLWTVALSWQGIADIGLVSLGDSAR